MTDLINLNSSYHKPCSELSQRRITGICKLGIKRRFSWIGLGLLWSRT